MTNHPQQPKQSAERITDLLNVKEISLRRFTTDLQELKGAEKYNYSRTRRMLTGERPITVEFIADAATLLGVDPSWIIFGTGTPHGDGAASAMPAETAKGCRQAIAVAVEVVFGRGEHQLNQRRADALRRMMIRLTHVDMRDAPWATDEGRERLLNRAAKALRDSETLHLRPEPVASLADEIRWNRLRNEDPTGWAGDYYARFADAALAPVVQRETQDIGNHTAE